MIPADISVFPVDILTAKIIIKGNFTKTSRYSDPLQYRPTCIKVQCHILVLLIINVWFPFFWRFFASFAHSHYRPSFALQLSDTI